MKNQLEKTEELDLPDEQQVVDYLTQNTDFFKHHSILLNDLEIPHEAGGAVSLIERQVTVMREKNAHFEKKLRDMVDAVHDNQRLNLSLHRLAVNLFDADSIDDVLGVVDDELRHKLSTDFVYFRLHNEKTDLSADDHLHTYVEADDVVLKDFSELIEKGRIQCGRLTDEQVNALFMDDANEVGSASIIPISVKGLTGIVALGSRNEQHYHVGMGTDFLTSLADLIGASMRAQLVK